MAIRDDLAVEAHTGVIPDDLATFLGGTDLVIDATISRAIGPPAGGGPRSGLQDEPNG